MIHFQTSQKKKKKEAELLILEYSSLVKIIAAKISKKGNLPVGIGFDDLISWGTEGLLKAKGYYSDVKGAQFKTYASIRIKGEILDHLRKEWKYRAPGNEAYRESIRDRISQNVLQEIDSSNVNKKVTKDSLITKSALVYMFSLDSELMNKKAKDVEDTSQSFVSNIDEKLDNSFVWNFVDGLEHTEKEIVKMIYKEGISQKAVSGALQMSRAMVSRVHGKILVKLKRRMSDYSNERY